MVVIPTLLTSVEGTRLLLEHLEVLALGNSDPNIHFAILSDFVDALHQDLPEDAAILEAARAGIEALNATVGSASGAEALPVRRSAQRLPSRIVSSMKEYFQPP